MSDFKVVEMVDDDGDVTGIYAIVDKEAEPEQDNDVEPIYQSADEDDVKKLHRTLEKPVKRGQYLTQPLGLDAVLIVSPNGAVICKSTTDESDELIRLIHAQRDLSKA